MESKYEKKLARLARTYANEKADRVPLRPFAAEFCAQYAGKTCQEVTHDYRQAFEAVMKICSENDFDAFVPNQVHLWSGLTQALGVNYYAVPGLDIKPNVGFQYLEPPEEQAFMRDDEYDELIDDPTAFLYNKWFPRVTKSIGRLDKDGSMYENNFSLVKGAMALWEYRLMGARHVQNMRDKTQTPPPFCGTFKAPFDIIGDKMRGYLGLTMDMYEQPDKVLKACEALMPYLCNVSLRLSDPDSNLPIAFWLHRGCKPFVSEGVFESHYWSTAKPIIEEFYRHKKQTLFYAEGAWHCHFDEIKKLPEKSIIYHADKDDIFEANKALGDKFCLSGGIPNTLLSFGKREDVAEFCKRVISEVAGDGGYLMDASAIMQNDTKVENFMEMMRVCREFGVYEDSDWDGKLRAPLGDANPDSVFGMRGREKEIEAASYRTPWSQKRGDYGEIPGDEALCERVWNDIEKLETMFIRQMLLCF